MKGQKGRVLISSIFAVLLCPGVPGGWEWGGGYFLYMAYTGRLFPKEVPFLGFRYI